MLFSPAQLYNATGSDGTPTLTVEDQGISLTYAKADVTSRLVWAILTSVKAPHADVSPRPRPDLSRQELDRDGAN